jgi:hypothetical protein
MAGAYQRVENIIDNNWKKIELLYLLLYAAAVIYLLFSDYSFIKDYEISSPLKSKMMAIEPYVAPYVIGSTVRYSLSKLLWLPRRLYDKIYLNSSLTHNQQRQLSEGLDIGIGQQVSFGEDKKMASSIEDIIGGYMSNINPLRLSPVERDSIIRIKQQGRTEYDIHSVISDFDDRRTYTFSPRRRGLLNSITKPAIIYRKDKIAALALSIVGEAGLFALTYGITWLSGWNLGITSSTIMCGVPVILFLNNKSKSYDYNTAYRDVNLTAEEQENLERGLNLINPGINPVNLTTIERDAIIVNVQATDNNRTAGRFSLVNMYTAQVRNVVGKRLLPVPAIMAPPPVAAASDDEEKKSEVEEYKNRTDQDINNDRLIPLTELSNLDQKNSGIEFKETVDNDTDPLLQKKDGEEDNNDQFKPGSSISDHVLIHIASNPDRINDLS